MAFLSRRTTASTSSNSHVGHPASLTATNGHANLGLGVSYNANNGSSLYLQQRGGSNSNSLMRRVSTMFSPNSKKKLSRDFFNDQPGSSMVIGSGVGYVPPQRSKKSWKKEKARRSQLPDLRDSFDSDLEDLEEIRQPNDLGPPASFITQEDENLHLSSPKKAVPQLKQQKQQRRLSIRSIQSLLPKQPDTSVSSNKRRSISQSVVPSLHSKNSSLHSQSYSHSLHSLSQSLLDEEAELFEDPVYTATKVTKASAIWAGPPRTNSAPNLVSLLPSTPPFTLNVRRKPPPRLGLRELPVEILARLFAFLPRKLILQLALLCKNFGQAAQIVIYGTLDLRNVSFRSQEELNALLTRRTDLTEMTRKLICDDRLPNSSSPYLPTFPSALVLAHMNHLTTLTLPHFSIDLLQHHTAFGLCSVSFLNTHLAPMETIELLTWLDGQVNITMLSFPRLFDPCRVESECRYDTADESNDPSPPCLITSSPSYLNPLFPPLSPKNSSLPPLSPSFAVPLPPSPSIPSPILSPSSATFPLNLNTLSTSPTLLPHLKTIRAPPSLLQLLAPYRANTLKKVGVNIDDTLVGGLRPAELVGFLKPSPVQFASSSCHEERDEEKEEEEEGTGLETLQLNFGRSVDKRTVEKVLGAAGVVLGNPVNSPESDMGGRGREKDVGSTNSHSTSRAGEQEHPVGLQNLEISIPWNGPGTEEVLYKTIYAVLPRYQALRSLVMRLQTVKKPFLEPQKPDITVLDRMTISLPAVRVNGLFDADPEDETKTLLSPTDTYENSVESEDAAPSEGHGHHSGSISSYASSSQSLASGGTAPSAGSMVSLTMFPKPPSSQRPTSMFYENSAGLSPSTTNAMELSHTPTAPSNQTFQTLMSSSPILTGSRTKTKNLLGRLPSLKRRVTRSETEPFPPLPYTSIHSNPTERSQTLPVLMPPLTPHTPTTSMSGSPSTAMPRTPTTSKMPSTPSTPRYSQSQAQTQARVTVEFDDDLPSQRWENRRISSVTTSGLSVSSSIRGVDWNHDNGVGSGSSEESSTPRTGTPVPEVLIPETPKTILTENERKHVRMWIRQCPTLRRVVFISGAEWEM